MDKSVLIVIIGMGLTNYLLRMLPMVILSKLNIPAVVIDWLGFVPVAVFAAILAPTVLLNGQGQLALNLDNKMLLAAIPCFLIAIKSRSLIFTLVAGMGIMAILQNFWG